MASYKQFREDIMASMDRIKKIRRQPKLGDVEAALKKDPAIDPPVGDYDILMDELHGEPFLGNVDECVCFDEDGNPLNECDECPR